MPIATTSVPTPDLGTLIPVIRKLPHAGAILPNGRENPARKTSLPSSLSTPTRQLRDILRGSLPADFAGTPQRGLRTSASRAGKEPGTFGVKYNFP
jgi:hypothetical protein